MKVLGKAFGYVGAIYLSLAAADRLLNLFDAAPFLGSDALALLGLVALAGLWTLHIAKRIHWN